MHRPGFAAPPLPAAPATCLMVALAGLACAPVLAQNALSPVDNVRYVNPHPDPENEMFASGMVSADFDGDGVSDLAVSEANAGRIRVYRGQPWEVGGNSPVIRFLSITIDTPFFNTEVAAGDFDGDGRDELVLGAPAANVAGLSDAGAVYVYDRATNGAWSMQEEIRLGESGYAGPPQQSEQLGGSLGVGNFNGDDYEDLAIGLALRDVNGDNAAGAVLVVYGSPAGLTSAGHRFFDRDDPLVPGSAHAFDLFGLSLASADFDDDGYDDLAVAARGAHCNLDGTGPRGGGVTILRGAPAGLSAAFSQWFAPGQDGVPGPCADGSPEEIHMFGSTLVARRLTFDLYADLVIGAPESGSGGAVIALYGQPGGLATEGAQVIRATDMPMPLAASAQFGTQVVIAPLRSGLFQAASLAIGAPGDRVNGHPAAGSVWVVHASANRPDPSTAQRWTANSGLAIGPAQPFDRFGTTLQAGDFNGDATIDLAIGAPFDEEAGQQAGAFQVIYASGFIFRDGFD